MGHAGIVAIPIPPGGAPGEVLTKFSAANYDTYWTTGGGGGGGGGADPGIAGAALMFFSDPDGEFEAPMPGDRGPAGPQGPTGSQGADGPALFVLPDDPDEPFQIPGPAGNPGPAGADGAQGPAGPPLFLLQDDPEEPLQIPGPQGTTGATGSSGAPGIQGSPGPALFMLPDDPEEPLQIPGPQGNPGTTGAAGAQGAAGPALFMLAEEAEPGEMGPPGIQGIQGPAGGGGGGSATVVEVNVGSTPVAAGRFSITDAAIGASSKIFIQQAPGPYTGKGTRADEADMDPLWCVAYPNGAGQAIAHWRTLQGMSPRHTPNTDPRALTTVLATGAARDYQNRFTPSNAAPMYVIGRIKGNVKFQYMVLS